MKTGHRVALGAIALFFLVTVGKSLAASAMGARVRLDVVLPATLVFFLPIRSTRPDGVRLYSALFYRVVSRPTEAGNRERVVQWWPKNTKSLDEDKK